MKNQALAIGLALAIGGVVSTPVAGQTAAPAGFYGGIALRDAGADATGVALRHAGADSTAVNLAVPSSVWGKFSSPVADDASSRTLLFGGYRFRNDIAVEASIATSDRYALRSDALGSRRGVGLSLTPGDAAAHAWNADVYTSWSFLPRFALYGRVGYAQADNASTAPGYATLSPGDPRRGRDGMNYGVGLRYDVNRALGLRVEYARFARFAGENLQGGVLPESDQLQVGVQLRF
jgi:opacity protein-like surface antigen